MYIFEEHPDMGRFPFLSYPFLLILSLGLINVDSHAQEVMPGVRKLYVSKDGSVRASGTVDGPFAGPNAAVAKAREIRAADPGAAIEIVIGAGEYHLQEAIVLGPELSGTQDRPFRIVAERGASVTFSGGRELGLQWERGDRGIWKAKVPQGLAFQQLHADGKRLIRARYPNYDPAVRPFQGYAGDAIGPERAGGWKDPAGGVVHSLHIGRWGGFHHEITGRDSLGQLVLAGGQQNNRPSAMHGTYRFIENIFEELDSQNEWFLDGKTSMLYFMPEHGADPNRSRFVASVLENLVSISGSEQDPVHDLVVSGIRFVHTAPTFMKTSEPLLRSDWTIYRQGAMKIEGAERCTILDNDFVGLGGNAIFVSNYNRRVVVRGNLIADIGAGGVNFVGDPNAVRSPSFQYSEYVPLDGMDTRRGPRSGNFPKDCEASDNLIRDIGLIEKQVAGVQVSMSQSLKILHNTIHDVPRSGINVGDGTWGGHDISFNDVFATVLETSDHGAFNSWGRDRFWHPDRSEMERIVAERPGLILSDAVETTRIHDNRFRCDHGWDIDLDDGSSNYEIYNNLCLSGGLKLREGFYRTVYNNVLVNNGFHPHVWFRDSHDVFRNNLVMAPHRDIRIAYWGDMVDRNLYVRQGDMEKDRSKGIERNATVVDPVFEDPGSGDFRLKNGGTGGFVNFDMTRFGVESPRLRAMAKSPEIPDLIGTTDADGTLTWAWKGGTFKSVSTLGEQSASGLPSMAGVLVLEIGENSPLYISGLREGDVILGYEGSGVSTLAEFRAAIRDSVHLDTPSVVIFRDQQRTVLKLRL